MTPLDTIYNKKNPIDNRSDYFSTKTVNVDY